MTTIAWDGTTLAADSRRTTGKHHRDDALKIVQVQDCWMGDEEVLLLAGAGSVPAIEGIIDNILKDPNNFRKFYSKANQAGLLSAHGRKASVLIITNKTTMVFTINGRDAAIDCYKVLPAEGHTDLCVALGSGGREAQTLMSLFSVKPILAVAAGGIAHTNTATGGTIVYAVVRDGRVQEVGSQIYGHTQDIHSDLMKHIKSSSCKMRNDHWSCIVPVRKGAGKPEPKTEDVVVKATAKKTAPRKKK